MGANVLTLSRHRALRALRALPKGATKSAASLNTPRCAPFALFNLQPRGRALRADRALSALSRKSAVREVCISRGIVEGREGRGVFCVGATHTAAAADRPGGRQLSREWRLKNAHPYLFTQLRPPPQGDLGHGTLFPIPTDPRRRAESAR